MHPSVDRIKYCSVRSEKKLKHLVNLGSSLITPSSENSLIFSVMKPSLMTLSFLSVIDCTVVYWGGGGGGGRDDSSCVTPSPPTQAVSSAHLTACLGSRIYPLPWEVSLKGPGQEILILPPFPKQLICPNKYSSVCKSY
jgi:hypothetical protein